MANANVVAESSPRPEINDPQSPMSRDELIGRNSSNRSISPVITFSSGTRRPTNNTPAGLLSEVYPGPTHVTGSFPRVYVPRIHRVRPSGALRFPRASATRPSSRDPRRLLKDTIAILFFRSSFDDKPNNSLEKNNKRSRTGKTVLPDADLHSRQHIA